MDSFFVSDIHGEINRLKKFFNICEKEQPDLVFIGGDILPNQYSLKSTIKDFLKEEFFLKIKKIKKKSKGKTRFFSILGNDDPKIFEKYFIDANNNKILEYIHFKTVDINYFYTTGYSFVPPTPFQLKDWEKYDVSQFVDIGVVSPELGIRTTKVDQDEIIYSTIASDLDKLAINAPVEKTIFLFHAPPYNTFLDRADLDNIKIDHVPVDTHIGSIAIKRFIENKKPFLTLHGHVHESARLTGNYIEKIGKTYCFSGAHDGPELALIRFNTENLKNASRELISII